MSEGDPLDRTIFELHVSANTLDELISKSGLVVNDHTRASALSWLKAHASEYVRWCVEGAAHQIRTIS